MNAIESVPLPSGLIVLVPEIVASHGVVTNTRKSMKHSTRLIR